MEQGHSAVLVGQAGPSSSLFEVAVGNLEALGEAVVELRYLCMLDCVSGALEWAHTATWVPPYIGSAGDHAAGVEQVRGRGAGGGWHWGQAAYTAVQMRAAPAWRQRTGCW